MTFGDLPRCFVWYAIARRWLRFSPMTDREAGAGGPEGGRKNDCADENAFDAVFFLGFWNFR